MEGFEQFVGVNFWTMIFAWINLVILYFILRKLVFKPIMKMIESRQNEVDDMYSKAEAYLDDARADKQEYEQKLGEVKEQGEEYMKAVVKRAQEREEQILREADEKADRVVRRAEEQVALEKKQAMNEIKDQVSDMALQIAQAVIERDVEQGEHADLIDSFISQMDAPDGKDR